jgi:hypothetical protein
MNLERKPQAECAKESPSLKYRAKSSPKALNSAFPGIPPEQARFIACQALLI